MDQRDPSLLSSAVPAPQPLLVLLQAYTVGVLVTFFDQAVVVQVLHDPTWKPKTIWSQHNHKICA